MKKNMHKKLIKLWLSNSDTLSASKRNWYFNFVQIQYVIDENKNMPSFYKLILVYVYMGEKRNIKALLVLTCRNSNN